MSARMRTLRPAALAIATIIFSVFLVQCQAKVFSRCELAEQLHKPQFALSLEEIANWVCIAEHASNLNSAAYASGLTGGSHGLFQISDVYWCSPPGKGFACNVPCEKLRDDDLTDDMACVRIIYTEHQRISGNGYTAWNAYEQYCRYDAQSYIDGCLLKDNNQQNYEESFDQRQVSKSLDVSSNFINDYSTTTQGKIYNKCELAKELYFKHKMPMEQIPTWVCIAQYESNFDTAAVGRLNADGSADHGLFQISDLYWCSNDRISGSKACGLSCGKLLDHDITDDVRCVRRIHDEHTRLSGDGFTAWTVYDPHCRDQYYEHVSHCFDQQTQLPKSYAVENSQTHLHAQAYAYTTPVHQHYTNPFLKHTQVKPYNTYSYHPSASASGTVTHNHVPYKPHKGKVYNRCELAQELYFKHKFPMQDIATWVCIAEHESNFETSAIGRLNGDGSADHGLFQVSDLYWCTHNVFGGKGCGLPCHKLLDSDLTDDIKCIRTIHDEHTRISGNGFTAWTVYNRDCHDRAYDISDCFDDKIQTTTDKETIKNNNSSQGKVYQECELAQELLMQHQFPLDQIATWICIAQHESSYNTAAIGRLNTDGSADHGLFQISDLFWCSHDDKSKGKACNMPCHKLLDSDITDDVQCIKTIHAEHTRLSGDGFTAWTVYEPYCRNQKWERISKCFGENFNATKFETPSPSPSHTKVDNAVGKGKVYKKCELARELHLKHEIPMEQVPTWVCIAQHESNYDTSAVGRLNTDGSADHGLFQVSDLYWCSHDSYGGKACNMPCHKLLDDDITDDVHCIKIIFAEHTRISGNGFTAWTVYKPHCQHQKLESVSKCFEENEIEHSKREETTTLPMSHTLKPKETKRKIYKKCELAQELFFKHKMPMWQVPTWVCIAQYESGFDTSAVGRLNADGSADHGLFQISDLYWCSHDKKGGKACNMPCEKLLDSDITDDVHCIKIIYDEHTRISGDGFTAWTVYNHHCKDQHLEKVSNCFDSDLLKKVERELPKTIKPMHQHVAPPAPAVAGINYNRIADYDIKSLKPKLPLNHPFIGNPFLNKINATSKITVSTTEQPPEQKLKVVAHRIEATNDVSTHLNYITNPFLQKFIKKGEELNEKDAHFPGNFKTEQTKVATQQFSEVSEEGPDYSSNPFLSKLMKIKVKAEQQKGGAISANSIEQPEKLIYLPNQDDAPSPSNYAANPFLNAVKVTVQNTDQTLPKDSVIQQTEQAAAQFSGNPFLSKISETSETSQEEQTTIQSPSTAEKKSTKQPAKFVTTSSERPFQHNPFLTNHPPESTQPIIRPTESTTVSMQAPKTNNYLNSDFFRRTTKPTTYKPITTINSKTTSKPFDYKNFNRISTTISTTPLTTSKTNSPKQLTAPATTSPSEAVTRPSNVPKTTTQRPTYTTTNRPFVIATPTTRKLSTTKTPKQTIASTEEQPTLIPTVGVPFTSTTTTKPTKQPVTSLQTFTTKTTSTTTNYRKYIQNLYNTTTTTTTTHPITLSSTKAYKKQNIQKSSLVTSQPYTTTTKKPSTTTVKYSRLNYSTWTTTPKPKPEKWSYNWADYFFTTHKTTTTTTKPTFHTTIGTAKIKFAGNTTTLSTTKSSYKQIATTNIFNKNSKTTTFRPRTTTIARKLNKFTTTSQTGESSKFATESGFTKMKTRTTTVSSTTTNKPQTTRRLTTTSRHTTTIRPTTTRKLSKTKSIPTITNIFKITSRPSSTSNRPMTINRLITIKNITTTSRPTATKINIFKTTSKPASLNKPITTKYPITTRRPTTTSSRFTTKKINTISEIFKTTSRARTTGRPFTMKYATKTSKLTTTKSRVSFPAINSRPFTTRKPTTTSTKMPTQYGVSNSYTAPRLHTSSNLTNKNTITTKSSSTEYPDKYRKDPFSHPFFAKYNEQFELLFGRRKNATSHSQRVTSPSP